MKKILATFVTTLLIASPAFAATVPVTGGFVDCDSLIFTDATTAATSSATSQQLLGCHQGNGNPENVTNVWGGTNSSVPHITPGMSATDAAGLSTLCPAFFSNYCVDISGTEYYKGAMRVAAKAALAVGTLLPSWTYWTLN